MSGEIKIAYLNLEIAPGRRPHKRTVTPIGSIPLTEGISPDGTYKLDDGSFLEVKALGPFLAGRDSYRKGLELKVVDGIETTNLADVLDYPRELREGVFMQTGIHAPGVARLGRKTWLRMRV